MEHSIIRPDIFGFTNAVPEQEAKELYAQYAMPAPARPLFQASFGGSHQHPCHNDRGHVVYSVAISIH